MNIRKHFELLGLKARDKITGVEGVITSIGFDLYGCIQIILNPGCDKDGKLKDQLWFDIARMEILSKKPVMDRPNFDFGPQSEGLQGPAEKPGYFRQ